MFGGGEGEYKCWYVWLFARTQWHISSSVLQGVAAAGSCSFTIALAFSFRLRLPTFSPTNALSHSHLFKSIVVPFCILNCGDCDIKTHSIFCIPCKWIDGKACFGSFLFFLTKVDGEEKQFPLQTVLNERDGQGHGRWVSCDCLMYLGGGVNGSVCHIKIDHATFIYVYKRPVIQNILFSWNLNWYWSLGFFYVAILIWIWLNCSSVRTKWTSSILWWAFCDAHVPFPP